MAYWWARKKAEYDAGLVASWDAEGGSSGSGAWIRHPPAVGERADRLGEGWAGGVRGQVVHHSVSVGAAWWGDTLPSVGSGGGLVLDLEAGRNAAALDEASLRARAQRARRR